ncbi:MAG: hypothetical protein E7546_02955 [Ruminococcaceae bacterium]|nr:hypothetical protein [Oscillospiraceae bacterium]
MAEKRERQIIDVSSGKSSAAPRKKSTAKKSPSEKKAKVQAVQTHAIISAENQGRAKKYRWGAVILWLLGLAFEILTILVVNGYLYIPGNTMTYIIIGLVADFICVVIGSQLWKKSNHIDPASEKNKIKFFLWNNMGLIASLICFVPIIIVLLKEKNLDAKTKKIATIIACIVAVIAGLASVDWNPVSAEDLAQAQSDAAAYTVDGSVYWTQFGKRYHLTEDCQSLQNSATLYRGTVEEAFEAKRGTPCKFCASQEAIAEVYGEKADDESTGIDLSAPLTETDDTVDTSVDGETITYEDFMGDYYAE